MLQPFVFIMCPCPFHLTLPPQRSSRLRWRRQTTPKLRGRKAPSWGICQSCWWQQIKPASLAGSCLVVILPSLFRVHFARGRHLSSRLGSAQCGANTWTTGTARAAGKADRSGERAGVADRVGMQMTLGDFYLAC